MVTFRDQPGQKSGERIAAKGGRSFSLVEASKTIPYFLHPHSFENINAIRILGSPPTSPTSNLEREEVRHRGIGDESRARALRANQGLYTQN